jgi:hypothetical protein
MRSVHLIKAAALAIALAMMQLPSQASMGPDDRTARLRFDEDEDEETCDFQDELMLDVGTVTAPDDDGRVNVELLVLLDGVGESLAGALLKGAQQSYEPLDIGLVPTFREVTLREHGATEITAEARELIGGRRPRGFDVVAILTSKDLTDVTGTPYVAGKADCIGGIKFDTFAFFVAEARAEVRNRWGMGLRFAEHIQARIVAHELGHVLGAEHHYANCAEGSLSALEEIETAPCTLMFNDPSVAASRFSVVNAEIVRGYANRFARP